MTEGVELIRRILEILQTYKSYGSDRANVFYTGYSKVPENLLHVRNIVIKNSPKTAGSPLYINYNLKRESETKIDVIKYPETFEGMILSFADRFEFDRTLYKEVYETWNQSKEYLKYEKKEDRPWEDDGEDADMEDDGFDQRHHRLNQMR